MQRRHSLKSAASLKRQLSAISDWEWRRKRCVEDFISDAQDEGLLLRNPVPTLNRAQAECGISIEFLGQLRQTCEDADLPRFFSSTRSFMEHVFQVLLDEHPACGLLDFIPAEHVGNASVYVSHCWDANFCSMIQALEKDFAAKWQAHYVYLESAKRTQRLSSSSINFEAGEQRELEQLQHELQAEAALHLAGRKHHDHRRSKSMPYASISMDGEECNLDAESKSGMQLPRLRPSLCSRRVTEPVNANIPEASYTLCGPASKPTLLSTLVPPQGTGTKPPRRCNTVNGLPALAVASPCVGPGGRGGGAAAPGIKHRQTDMATSMRTSMEALMMAKKRRARSEASADAGSSSSSSSCCISGDWKQAQAKSMPSNSGQLMLRLNEPGLLGPPCSSISAPPSSKNTAAGAAATCCTNSNSEGAQAAAQAQQHKGAVLPQVTPGLSSHYRGAVLGSRGYGDLQALQSEFRKKPLPPPPLLVEPGPPAKVKQAEPVKQLLLSHQRKKSLLIGFRDLPDKDAPPGADAAEHGGGAEGGRARAREEEQARSPWTRAASEQGEQQQQQSPQQSSMQLGRLPSMFEQQASLATASKSRRTSWIEQELEQLQTERLPPLELPGRSSIVNKSPTGQVLRRLPSRVSFKSPMEQVHKQAKLLKHKQQLIGRFLWIDIFSLPREQLNPPQGKPDDENGARAALAEVAQTIKSIGRVCVIMDPCASVCERAWMLFEVWTALKLKRALSTLSVVEPESRPQTAATDFNYDPGTASPGQRQGPTSLPSIDLTASKASSNPHRLAILAGWMSEVDSPKSDMSSLGDVAITIQDGLKAALSHEQKRPALVRSMYSGLIRCRRTWGYNDGTLPLRQDINVTIDALEAFAKGRFKTELDHDPSLELIQSIPDRELYLWQLIKFLLRQLTMARDEPLWISALKHYEGLAERSFSSRFSNGVISAMMLGADGSLDLGLLQQGVKSARIAKPSNAVL